MTKMMEKIKTSRLYTLIYKFCSVKGLFVILSTIALFQNKVSEYVFALAWVAFIGSRELYKHLKDKPCGKE